MQDPVVGVYQEWNMFIGECLIYCQGGLCIYNIMVLEMAMHMPDVCHDQTFSRDHSHDPRPRDLSPDERLAIKNFVSSHKPYCPSKVRLETLSRFRLYTQHTFPPIMPVAEDPYQADPYHSYSGLYPLFYVSS